MDERVSIVEEVMTKPHLITDKSSYAKSVDSAKVYVRMFEALKELGQTASTKYIFPMEFTSLLENFVKRQNE